MREEEEKNTKPELSTTKSLNMHILGYNESLSGQAEVEVNLGN